MPRKNDSSDLINKLKKLETIEITELFKNPPDEMFEMLKDLDVDNCKWLIEFACDVGTFMPTETTVERMLEAMPEESKKPVFEKANTSGWNILMRAIHRRRNLDVIKLLLKAIPEESKKVVFKQTQIQGWNALLIAACEYPKAIEPLLQAMPDELMKTVFEQAERKNGANALRVAAYCHPGYVQTMLAMMPDELVIEHFQQERSWLGFICISETFEALFSNGQLGTVLELLKKNLIPQETNAFKCVVKHKQQLLDYILDQDADTRNALLEEINDNNENSSLARVFHTSRGIMAPRPERGILGQAINARSADVEQLAEKRSNVSNQFSIFYPDEKKREKIKNGLTIGAIAAVCSTPLVLAFIALPALGIVLSLSALLILVSVCRECSNRSQGYHR